jgi:hypothetical protein
MLNVFETVITIPGAVIDVHWPVKGSRLTRSLQELVWGFLRH